MNVLSGSLLRRASAIADPRREKHRKRQYSNLHVFLYLLVCLLPAALWSQGRPAATLPAATEQGFQQVKVNFANVLRFQQLGDSSIQRLIGNVELSQDSVFMFCDSATIANSTRVEAFSNIILQQGDSISGFADTLLYDGILKEADLFGRVVLANGRQKLYTDRLHYDLKTKLATYTTGATLVNDSTRLTSISGYYYADQEVAYFKDSVLVIDPKFALRADSLRFDARENRVVFIGPTRMRVDSSEIYCEAGFYDIDEDRGEFSGGAQYRKGEQTASAEQIIFDGRLSTYILQGNARVEEGEGKSAVADTIIYNRQADKTRLIGNAVAVDGKRVIQGPIVDYDGRQAAYQTLGRSLISEPPQLLEADSVRFEQTTGFGLASGRVIWQDTSQQLSILCEQALYRQEDAYLKASGGVRGRPLMKIVIESDTLYMAADTLLSTKADTTAADSARLLQAYRDVRIFKSNLQALADSVAFSQQDELFRFFREPVIWSDTSQFTADTIFLALREEALHRIYLFNDAFIINSPDELFYNQVKGKKIEVDFVDNNLHQMFVSGNAESVYYALDEQQAYVGVNKTVCSEMKLLFENNQVNEIMFYNQPAGRLDPMGAVDHEKLRLAGFVWQKDIRPKDIDDLFGPPKRTITALPQTSPAQEESNTRDNEAPPATPANRSATPRPAGRGGGGL